MPLTEEKFDQDKIDSLKRFLQREAEKGRKKDYEIIVDGFRVVSRTDDINEFDDYEQEIKTATRNLSIVIYDGAANRNTRYSFSLKQAAEQGLNGAPQDLNGIIQEKLDARDREHEMKQLKEKVADTEEQLEEAEEYHDLLEGEIKKLEARIRELESGDQIKKMELGDMAGAAIQGLIRANAQRIISLPGGQALAGIFGLTDAPPNAIPAAPAEDANVTFEKKENSGEELKWQQFRKQMMRDFPNDVDAVFAIIHSLSKQPDLIPTVAQLLNIKTEKV